MIAWLPPAWRRSAPPPAPRSTAAPHPASLPGGRGVPRGDLGSPLPIALPVGVQARGDVVPHRQFTVLVPLPVQCVAKGDRVGDVLEDVHECRANDEAQQATHRSNEHRILDIELRLPVGEVLKGGRHAPREDGAEARCDQHAPHLEDPHEPVRGAQPLDLVQVGAVGLVRRREEWIRVDGYGDVRIAVHELEVALPASPAAGAATQDLLGDRITGLIRIF
mmetsp:Transcript_110367/g.307484  ORF Transcript_110367/g.307484 Transcript_110367/m.307484 type:complete len:221 (+) Transcript_110367:1-663(+)